MVLCDCDKNVGDGLFPRRWVHETCLALLDKAFIKLKFNDFTTTTVERVGTKAVEADYQDLLVEGWERKSRPIRLIGLGVRLISEGEHASERLPFSDTPLAEH